MAKRLSHLGQSEGSCSPLGWVFTALFGATAVGLGVLLYQNHKELEQERAKKKGGGGLTLEKAAKTAAKVLPFLI